jgi:hypothetical protein
VFTRRKFITRAPFVIPARRLIAPTFFLPATYLSPPQIQIPQQASLVAHFDAQTLTGSSGSSISSWTDSVNSIVAAQGTSARQPLLETAQAGGLQCARFSTSALTIATPGALQTALDSQICTVAVVMKVTATSPQGVMIGSLDSSSTGMAHVADGVHIGPILNNIFPLATSSSNLVTYCCSSIKTPPWSGANPAGVTALNGGVAGMVNLPPTTLGTTICIGGNAALQSVDYFNGDIYDILVWNVSLLPPDIANLQIWAANKYAQALPWSGLTSMLVCDGDSVTAGSGETGLGSYPAQMATSLSLSYGQWMNLGKSGAKMSDMTTLAPTWIDPLPVIFGMPIKLCCFEWYNQAAAPSGPYNNSMAYLLARKTAMGSNVKTVFGTSDDDSTTETDRALYDTACDGSHPNADSYVPIHNNTFIGVAGAQAANPTYFAGGGGGPHLTNLGYGVLAGLFQAGL